MFSLNHSQGASTRDAGENDALGDDDEDGSNPSGDDGEPFSQDFHPRDLSSHTAHADRTFFSLVWCRR